jgi:steroid 5-alpha reductase family enzyme
VFPNKIFEEPVTTMGSFIVTSSLLNSYWVFPYAIASNGIDIPLPQICAAIIIFVHGIFLTFVSDMQKHATLKVKRGLVMEGMFALCRNPNYLGESLIHLSYTILTNMPP